MSLKPLTVAIAAALSALAPAGGEAAAAPSPPAAAAPQRTILFVGNSFTQGAHSALRNWRADTVTDLNGDGYGGVPALFAAFARQSGLNYRVSLETQGGKTLAFHYDERRQKFDRAWDVVVLQELSTFTRDRPGDPTTYFRDVKRLSSLLQKRNPKVDIRLMATWTRADQTFRKDGHWYGKPVTQMADDLHAAALFAKAQTPGHPGVLPVGKAWNRAFATGVADPNPYDGTSFGQLDLWTYDQYHASVAGYYLEALVVFGAITGIDPTRLGPGEASADTLGLSEKQAAALQVVARDTLAANR